MREKEVRIAVGDQGMREDEEARIAVGDQGMREDKEARIVMEDRGMRRNEEARIVVEDQGMRESQERHVAVVAFVPESRARMLERMADEISVTYEKSVTEASLVRELVELAWQLFISRTISHRRTLGGPEFLGMLRIMGEQAE